MQWDDFFDAITPIVGVIAGTTIIVVALIGPVKNNNVAITAIGTGGAIAGSGGYLAGKRKHTNKS